MVKKCTESPMKPQWVEVIIWSITIRLDRTVLDANTRAAKRQTCKSVSIAGIGNTPGSIEDTLESMLKGIGREVSNAVDARTI